jgi:hypothetical protein
MRDECCSAEDYSFSHHYQKGTDPFLFDFRYIEAQSAAEFGRSYFVSMSRCYYITPLPCHVANTNRAVLHCVAR